MFDLNYYISRMRLRAILCITILTYVSINIHAQSSCSPIHISINSQETAVFPTSNLFGENKNYESFFKFNINAVLSDCNLTLNFLHMPENLNLSVYHAKDVSCSSIGDAIFEKKINGQSTNLKLSGLIQSGAFVIGLSSNKEIPNYFAVIRNVASEGCDQNFNRTNSIHNPLPIKVNGIESIYSQSGCNAKCRRLSTNIIGERVPTNPKMRWYELDCDNLAFFDVEVVSTTKEIEPFIWIVNASDKTYHKIATYNAASKTLTAKYLPTFYTDKLLIGVGGKNNQILEYDINIKGYSKNLDCIDFLEEESGDSIVVVSTSKGSPFEGPFLEGEDVTFCYQVSNWFPVHHNWLQSVIPTFEDGWDRISFDSLHIHKPILSTLSDTASLIGNWNWIETGLNDRGEGQPTSKFKGPGWYFDSNIHRTRAGHQYSWGRKNTAYKNDVPLYQFCFTLRTVDSFDCHRPPNVDVTIATHSDVFTGRFRAPACTSEPEQFSSFVRCCDTIKDISASDSILCEGEKASLSLVSDASELIITWHLGEPRLGEILGQGNNVDFLAPTIDDEQKQFLIYATGVDVYGQCHDTTFVSIWVKRKPNFEIEEQVSVCLGDFIHVFPTFESGSKNLNEFTVEWKSIGQDNNQSSLSQVDISLQGNVEESEIFRISVIDEEGCTDEKPVEIISNDYYIPHIDSVYHVCRNDDAKVVLEIEEEVTLEYRPIMSENDYWSIWNNDGQNLSKGSYKLKSTTPHGCELSTEFRVEDGSTRDSLFIVYCSDRNDLNSNSRSDEEEIRYYFKPADCPQGDTVTSYKFNEPCDDLSPSLTEATLIDTKVLGDYLTVYPNPVSGGRMTVNIEDDSGIDRICILNLSGRLVECYETDSKEDMQINVGSLPVGQYFLIGMVGGQVISVVGFYKV